MTHHLPRKTATALLDAQIGPIQALRGLSQAAPAFVGWVSRVRSLVANLFGDDSRQFTDFTGIQYHAPFGGPDRASYQHGLDKAEAQLRALIAEIDTFWPDDAAVPATVRSNGEQPLSYPVSASKARSLIEAKIAAIEQLRGKERGSLEFKKWQKDCEVVLANVFGENTRQFKDFQGIKYTLGFYSTGTPESSWQSAYLRGLDTADAYLRAFVSEIENFPRAEAQGLGGEQQPAKSVFIVHGHDEGMKQHVARKLSVLGLSPIILHEQANEGKTLIDKFEANANVSFAVVLLSPDDLARPANAKKHTRLRPRARQNVILELGYFAGRLQRDRVFVLVKGDDLEIPGDLGGVVYTKYDPSESWRLELVRELNAAGFDVDANALIARRAADADKG